MNRRIWIAAGCMVLSLILFFFVFPLLTARGEDRCTVCVAVADIRSGQSVGKTEISLREMAACDVPADALREWPQGAWYARLDLPEGTVIRPSLLTQNANDIRSVMERLPADTRAVSVTLSSMAAGVSGMLKGGDVVSLYVLKRDGVEKPPELSEVIVLTSTTSSGIDAEHLLPDEEGKRAMPATLTLAVSEAQARRLMEAMSEGDIFAVFVRAGGPL